MAPTPPITPVPSQPAPRRGRLQPVLRAAFVLACAAGGAFGSFVLRAEPNPSDAATAEPDEPVSPDIAPAKGEPPPDLTNASLAVRIDTLIRAGCYATALQSCRDAPRDTFGGECPLAYRAALCLEGQGRWKEADAAFQTAEADADLGARARALLGRARCAVAQDVFPAAQALVDRVLLRSGHPDCRDTNVREEAMYLRAVIAVREEYAGPALDPFDADALAWPSLRAPADRLLDWLPAGAGRASPTADDGNDVVELHPEEEPGAAPHVTARLAARPLLALVHAVATAAGLQIRADNDVAPLLGATAGPVDVEHVPLDDLFALLTNGAGVAWTIRGEALVLSRVPGAAEPGAAAEALRRALALAPGHPSVGALRVALANLDLRAGRVRSAARGYKQVIEVGTSAPEATHAAYNLGLLELREGDRGGARARFLEVIDRAPGTRWGDLAWCWVARTHLDGDDAGAARAAYRRALDGKTKEAASAAALGLCACDLLDGSDEAARDLLRDARFGTRDAHARLAALFEALLRYRAGPTESRHELLLTALRAADDGRALGPAGVYLAGRAYAELGRAQQMSDLYDAAAGFGRGPLVIRMTFEAAERYDRLDRRNEARSRYAALAAADPEGFGAWAELKLAELDARDGNGAAAVRRCQTLASRPGIERAALLAVMGRGYELQKKYGHAAECFAGRVPGE